ncbi:hypothetical protein C8J56DRAFT_1156713 [Mycena floridula]|nr:hypothetical protein C8J56DRAFT_1156713 [Mycena floridula]
MNYITSYLEVLVSSIFHGENGSESESDSIMTIGISPSNSSDSNTSSSDSDQADDREPTMIQKILSRSVSIPKASIPQGWSNDWYYWSFSHALDAVYDTSSLEIYLGTKYGFEFKDVKLLMFKRSTEQLVFQYRYDYESVDDFLQRREEDDAKRELVDAVEIDLKCIQLVKAQSLLDQKAYYDSRRL